MRRKKLLRQVAAAAVALSMAVSLSAPAFAEVITFDLANGGLVITAKDDGITVEQDNRASSTIGKDDEIVITGTYNGPDNPYGGAMQTAEEDQQDETQTVTLAMASAEEETSEETSEATSEATSGAEDTPASEETQEQNSPANGELNASAGEGQDEERQEPKPEAVASTSASASASDDTSDNASNEPRRAPAYGNRMSWEEEKNSYTSGLRAGIVQIINNTANKIKVSLSGAHIDLPGEAGTLSRGQAAIDVQGTGDVELKFSGSNTLTGSGRSAGIQKNDNVSTGTLTITADSQSDTLDVKVDKGSLGQDNQGAAIGDMEEKPMKITVAMARRTL